MFFKYRTHAVAKRHRCVMLAANLRPDLHSYIRQSPLKPRPEPLVRPPRLAPADAGGAHSRWMTTNMTDIKSEEDAVQPKEQTYAAAPQWRRICAGFIDTITVGGIAACIAEHWIATYNAGAETLPAVFATLWVLRDQLPSTSSQNHPSLGKRMVWVQLVQADSSARGDQGLVKAYSTAHTSKLATRGMKLLRNAHWLAVVPLTAVVPDYWMLPTLLFVMPTIELGSIMLIGRTFGDVVSGTVAVYEDTLGKELREREKDQSQRTRRERARRIKVMRLKKSFKIRG